MPNERVANSDESVDKKKATRVRGLVNKWRLGGNSREQAEDALKEIGPDAISTILKDLASVSTLWRRTLQIGLMLGVAALTSFTVYFVVDTLFSSGKFKADQAFSQAFMWCVMGIWGVYALRNNNTQILAIFDDIRGIPALVAGLEFKSSNVRWASKEALKRLLPKVQPEDANLFDANTLRVLNESLLNQPVDLALPVLSAIRTVGDSSSLPYVERLITRKTDRANENEAIQGTVAALIPVLRNRAEQERISNALLRPSEPPEPNNLLTPAAPANDQHPEMLLRPHSNQN